ncbi:beta-glucosidase [Aquipluma nitroreducens]|uniref:Beta-glucosidase n=1 Tax=Aquipluma nitroreducens TaxID=2010828 RepID=A0A5K7SDL4_9BACT|nr:glycoside hydrolase family 3 C-terminal domain-containing protein [Aquipluma nitroreducens]BBE19537.1 beta-glucosidase [Aquipluma nitroreducens]
MKLNLYILLLSICPFLGISQNKFQFQNTNLSTQERVESLLSEMTVQEKMGQMLFTSPAIERLGVPEYNWWNECLHGVARAGYATVFPQSITIAASWDKDLLHEVASVISDEARAKHHEFVRRGMRDIYQGLTFWSPNINIFRDPRWGRGHETFGEDPYLTGQLGTQFVKGLQGDDPNYLKVVATAKHFAVHSGPEPSRHVFDAKVSERDLRETYLPAFRTLVVDGGVYSVMGAYNRFRGEACCASPFLSGILRNEWGFKGYIVSDCWAIADIWQYHKIAKDEAEAAAMAVKTGTDLECGNTYKALPEALKRGLITEKDLDVCVGRLLTARMKLGMFDPDEKVAYAQIPFSVNDNPAHDRLSRVAAQKSIVLLKNANHTLPLKKNLAKVAVIGPNADEIESLWGNYNGIPSHPVTVLQGIKNKISPQVEVLYAQGSELADGVTKLTPIPSIYLETEDGKQGALGEYFANNKLEGKPLFTRIDDNVDFYWEAGSPDPRMPVDNFSVRWTTYLKVPQTGDYEIGIWSMPNFKIYCDGKEILGGDNEHHAFHSQKKLTLETGKRYKLVFDYKNYHGDGTASLLWEVPQPNMLADAIETAKKSDVVVLVLGLNQRLEGEEMPIQVDGFKGGDRTHLDLPKTQEKLMEAIKATGKPVVLVLLNGSALSINYAAENMDAILSAGYPGQEGGNAVADVLFGDYNPAGRLPVTYYKSVDQLPAFENYDMEGRTYRYFRQSPLYPFGFGLSYTNFTYTDLNLPKEVKMGEDVTVSVKVTNTGDRDGDEVVQLYLTDEKASTPRPIRSLEGFKRISLKKGESQIVSFTLVPRQLSMINDKDKQVVEPGFFTIAVGGEQPGFTGAAKAETTGTLSGRMKLIGKTLEIR